MKLNKELLIDEELLHCLEKGSKDIDEEGWFRIYRELYMAQQMVSYEIMKAVLENLTVKDI